MFVYKEFAVWQVSVILRDVGFIICNVGRTAKVITVIEEGFFFRSIVWDITITSLWVIRVAWVIPAYRWTGVGSPEDVLRITIIKFISNKTIIHKMVFAMIWPIGKRLAINSLYTLSCFILDLIHHHHLFFYFFYITANICP